MVNLGYWDSAWVRQREANGWHGESSPETSNGVDEGLEQSVRRYGHTQAQDPMLAVWWEHNGRDFSGVVDTRDADGVASEGDTRLVVSPCDGSKIALEDRSHVDEAVAYRLRYFTINEVTGGYQLAQERSYGPGGLDQMVADTEIAMDYAATRQGQQKQIEVEHLVEQQYLVDQFEGVETETQTSVQR